MLLEDKKIMITGASGTLGSLVARRCLDEGAELFLPFRNANSLKKFNKAVGFYPDNKIRILFGDFLDNQFINSNFPISIVTHEGMEKKFDGLVNCVGEQGNINKFINIQWDEWERIIKINLLIPARIMQIMIPFMNDNGQIINISGGGATSCRTNFSAYAVAKTGLVRLTEILAKENPKFQINAIAPGAFYSNMAEKIINVGLEIAGKMEYTKSLQLKKINKKPNKAVELIINLFAKKMQGITGRLIASEWDDWENFVVPLKENMYKLRRVIE